MNIEEMARRHLDELKDRLRRMSVTDETKELANHVDDLAAIVSHLAVAIAEVRANLDVHKSHHVAHAREE